MAVFLSSLGLPLHDEAPYGKFILTRSQLSATNTSITAKPSGNYSDTNPMGKVTVLGLPDQVSNVTLNGQAVDGGWSWNSTTHTLSLTGLNNLTSNGTWNSEWTLSWGLSGGGGSSGGGSGSDPDPSGSASGSLAVPGCISLVGTGLVGAMLAW